jgi:hypothetical protein
MNDSDFYPLLPLKTDVLRWDTIVNRIGFQPELPRLRKFLAVYGYHYCNGQCFKRASAIIVRSGRPPDAKELRVAGNRTFYDRETLIRPQA